MNFSFFHTEDNKGDNSTFSIPHFYRGVLFEFHLKFWNTDSIGIPVRSLQLGRQTSD